MRYAVAVLITLLAISCTVRRPVIHDPVIVTYENAKKRAVLDELLLVLADENIMVKAKDYSRGTVVTDSFDVEVGWCDCGKNLFGADYPGERRGVMKITVSGDDAIKVRFVFETRLVIKVNNRKLLCGSFGILEKRVLERLEQRLGITGIGL